MKKYKKRSGAKLRRMERTDISEAPGLFRFGGRLKVLRSTRRYLMYKVQFYDRKNGTFGPLVTALLELMDKIEEIETEVFLAVTGERDEIGLEMDIKKYFLTELNENVSECGPIYDDYEEKEVAVEDAIELMYMEWEEVCKMVQGLQDALQSAGDSIEFLRPTWFN